MLQLRDPFAQRRFGLLRTLNGAAAGLHQSVVTDLLFLRDFQRFLLPRRYRRFLLDDWLLQGKLRIEVTHCGIRRCDVRMGVIKRRLEIAISRSQPLRRRPGPTQVQRPRA